MSLTVLTPLESPNVAWDDFRGKLDECVCLQTFLRCSPLKKVSLLRLTVETISMMH